MRKGWDDALDLQNDLRRSLRTSEGQRYMDWYSRGQSKGLRFINGEVVERRLDPGSFRQVTDHAISVIETGDPMWVSEEVSELVQWASEKFEPEAVHPHDLLIPNAFCLLPSPWASVDIKGRIILFRAISWGIVQWDPDNPGDQGVAIALWSHADDEDDYTRSERSFPRRVAGCPLVLKHVAAFRWGDADAMKEPTNHVLFKQVQVLWRLAWQTIVSSTPEYVSRPVWRNKSNWRQIKTVQVLILRRTHSKARSSGESTVEWTHRFPVRGHWRWQWYPSIQQHHQIFIAGYIKGPDDKPFVAKQSAVEFIR